MTEFAEKNHVENKEMDLKNGVNNIQTEGYNGARTMGICCIRD